MILQKVSDDRDVFKKELKKSLVWLNSFETMELKKWVYDKFGDTHRQHIKEVFELFYQEA